MKTAPETYYLVTYGDGTWACGDVIIDADTDEPATDELGQRLMRDSVRELPVSDPQDLSEVVWHLVARMIHDWGTTVESPIALDDDREFAVAALALLKARMEDSPPMYP